MTLPNILRGYLDTRGTRKTGAQQAELQTIPMVLSLLRQQTQDQRQATMDAEQAALSPLRKRIMEAQAKAAENPTPKSPHFITNEDGQFVVGDNNQAVPITGPDGQPLKGSRAPGDSFSFPTGTDENGKPVVLRGNNRTGKIERTDIGRPAVGTATNGLSQTQANQVKKQQEALINLQKSLAALRSHVEKNGVAYLPGTQERASLEPLVRDAQIQFKEAANLGAITGPDMKIIEGMLGNPASLSQLWRGRQEGALAGFDQVEQSLLRRAQTISDVYGVPMPDAFNAATTQTPTSTRTIMVNGKQFVVPE